MPPPPMNKLELTAFLCYRAYWGFAEHFKEQAESLLNSLDPAKQRLLQGGATMSSSSSNNSLNSTGGGASRVASAAGAKSKSRSRSMSNERASTALYRLVLQSGIGQLPSSLSLDLFFPTVEP